MMISPECYRSSIKNKDIRGLIKERNSILNFLKNYENEEVHMKGVRNSFPMVLEHPSMQVRYHMNNLYLIEVTKLILEKEDEIENLEVEDKKITSIEVKYTSYGEIRLEEANTSKLKIYRHGKIVHELYNELSKNPIEEYEYTIPSVEMNKFFEELLSVYHINEWQGDFYIPVMDGWSWDFKIRYSDNSIIKYVGTIEPPPNGDSLAKRILQLVDYKITPNVF